MMMILLLHNAITIYYITITQLLHNYYTTIKQLLCIICTTIIQ